jgi:hypothetical protein
VIVYERLPYLMMRINTFGDLMHQVHIQQNPPIGLSSLDRSRLNLGGRYGSVGHLGSVNYSSGFAVQNRCWTADRLARRGITHREKCPLCDQEEETIQHLLTRCVFSRQVWLAVLSPLEIGEATPHSNERSFANWWAKTALKVKECKKRSKFCNHPDSLGDMETPECLCLQWKLPIYQQGSQAI